MAGVKAQPKTCQLFQLMCWPEGHKVPSSTNSLVELMNMVERWRHKTEYGPVLVVSMYVHITTPIFFNTLDNVDIFLQRDGTSRAGVYCAANACIEQVIQHGEVDVFQAVKNVRRHRPQLIENLVSLMIASLTITFFAWLVNRGLFSSFNLFVSDRVQVLLRPGASLCSPLFTQGRIEKVRTAETGNCVVGTLTNDLTLDLYSHDEWLNEDCLKPSWITHKVEHCIIFSCAFLQFLLQS